MGAAFPLGAGLVAVLGACGAEESTPVRAPEPFAHARGLDLTGAVPPTATTVGVVVAGGGLVLDGVTEGTLEVAVTDAMVGGRQLRLDADRYSEVTAGDMEGVTSGGLGNRNSTVVLDAWRTYASSLANAPTFPLVDGSTVARVADTGSLIQYFPVVPGEEYRLSFSADTTSVALGEVLFLTWSLHDADLTTTTPKLIHDTGDSRASWRRLDTDATVTTSSTSPWYGPERGAFDERFRLLVPDCDDHVLYEGGTATSADTLARNACMASDGTVLTTEATLSYLGLEFAVGAGSADLDDVRVEYQRQLELEILDGAGAVLQSSTLDSGFYVEPNPAIAALRLVLRSSRVDRSPLVRRLTVDDGVLLQVVVGARPGGRSPRRSGSTSACCRSRSRASGAPSRSSSARCGATGAPRGCSRRARGSRSGASGWWPRRSRRCGTTLWSRRCRRSAWSRETCACRSRPAPSTPRWPTTACGSRSARRASPAGTVGRCSTGATPDRRFTGSPGTTGACGRPPPGSSSRSSGDAAGPDRGGRTEVTPTRPSTRPTPDRPVDADARRANARAQGAHPHLSRPPAHHPDTRRRHLGAAPRRPGHVLAALDAPLPASG